MAIPWWSVYPGGYDWFWCSIVSIPKDLDCFREGRTCCCCCCCWPSNKQWSNSATRKVRLDSNQVGPWQQSTPKRASNHFWTELKTKQKKVNHAAGGGGGSLNVATKVESGPKQKVKIKKNQNPIQVRRPTPNGHSFPPLSNVRSNTTGSIRYLSQSSAVVILPPLLPIRAWIIPPQLANRRFAEFQRAISVRQVQRLEKSL